jgi:hypothetical protein
MGLIDRWVACWLLPDCLGAYPTLNHCDGLLKQKVPAAALPNCTIARFASIGIVHMVLANLAFLYPKLTGAQGWEDGCGTAGMAAAS